MACICMLHVASQIIVKHLVRYSRNEVSLGRPGCRALHGSLLGKCVDKRRELDSAGSGRVQRQIFAVKMMDRIRQSGYYM